MVDIERKEFKKIISKLIKKDKDNNSYIDFDEFNALYFTDENRKEIIEILVEKNIELRKIVKEEKKVKDAKLEPVFIPATVDKSRFSRERRFYNIIQRVRRSLLEELGREPTNLELAKEAGTCPERIEENAFFVERCSNIADYEELNEVVGTDMNASFVGQEDYQEDQYVNIYRQELRKLVLDYLSSVFEPLEVEIYKYYYGLDDEGNHSINETADKFNLSKSDIAKVIFNANRIVKKLLWKNKCDDYIYDLEMVKETRRI